MMIRTLSFIALCMTSTAAMSASFKLPKAGEWKVKVVESSIHKNLKDVPMPEFSECIENSDDLKNWEEQFRKSSKDSHMNCDIKNKSEDANKIVYSLNCKPETGARKANDPSLEMLPKKVEGTMSFVRVSDTQYTLQQDMKILGLTPPKIDLSKVPVEQRKMIEDTIKVQSGDASVTSKSSYTYVSAKCSEEAKKNSSKNQ